MRLLRSAVSAMGLTVYGGVNAPYLWVGVPSDTDSGAPDRTFCSRLHSSARRAPVSVRLVKAMSYLTAFGARKIHRGSDRAFAALC